MTEPRQSQIRWWVLIGVLGLLRSGTLFAYDTDTKLETALREVQTASATEPAKTEKLSQKAEELSKAPEQAQARGKALEDNYRASEQAKGGLAAKAKQLTTTLQKLQRTFAEQAKTKKLTQKVEELSKALDQAQARGKALEENHRASEQAKGRLAAKARQLTTALQKLQRTYATEQTKTKKLTQKVGDLSKALEQTQARGKALEDNYRASEQAKGELAAKATKLETARRESQTTSATGQAKTKKLTRQTAEMLELVSRLRADVVVLHDAIGVSYTMLGMKEEALRAFHRALELDPNHAESHLDLARLYSEYLDDGEAAAPHFRRYVQLRPEAKNAERIKGWLMKADKELEIKKRSRSWGKGFFQGLYKIFD